MYVLKCEDCTKVHKWLKYKTYFVSKIPERECSNLSIEDEINNRQRFLLGLSRDL